jgi:hypothetical protein
VPLTSNVARVYPAEALVTLLVALVPADPAPAGTVPADAVPPTEPVAEQPIPSAAP